jgi:hypothetical protein
MDISYKAGDLRIRKVKAGHSLVGASVAYNRADLISIYILGH